MRRDDSIAVLPVASRRQWREFFNLRRKIYRRDPNVVYPLRFMEREMLDQRRHPFYLHARRQPFLCYRDGEPVGRIVAIKDNLYNEYYADRLGFFGFFESIDDLHVAQTLLRRAESWLEENGCDRILGPVNPSMKSDFGVLVMGNDDPPFVMMGYTPKYYENLLVANGLTVAREFYAYLYDVPSTYDLVMAMQSELLNASRKILARYHQWKIESATCENLDETLRVINRAANEIRSAGWGFVPLTEAELSHMIRRLKRVIIPEHVLLATWEGQVVGYCINVPCINWALRKSIGRWDWIRLPQFLFWLKRTARTRVIAVGADKAYRNRGGGVLLSCEMRTRGVSSLNFRQWEFSWIDSLNVESIRNLKRTMPVTHSKTLRLYEKPIT
jgi:hypothetical protein